MQDEISNLSCIAGDQILSTQRIGAGKNSRVYKVLLQKIGPVAIKFYFSHPSDARDRLGTEYQSLEFLWKNGIRCVPEPIAIERSKNCAVYRFIESRITQSSNIGLSDIDQCIDFMASLHKLSKLPDAVSLGNASEACFSIKAIISTIDARLLRLSQLPYQDNDAHRKLKEFLLERFTPFFDRLLLWIDKKAKDVGISLDDEIDLKNRTLSPSDFGFHNAVFSPTGTWIFQDFEYFGWDDPAKLISDFILHPAMLLPEFSWRRFLSGALSIFSKDPELPARLHMQYPLWGLKWCMILLNEFIPEAGARRAFAGAVTEAALQERQLRQVQKAAAMLERVENSRDAIGM